MTTDGLPPRYPRTLGGVVLLAGGLLFVTWSVRAYILFLTEPGDSSFAMHATITTLSLIAAVLLVRIGRRAVRRQGRASDVHWLIAIGAWILGVGGHRLFKVLTQPAHDPNPTAHLHLSVLFLVIGTVLWGAAWRWTRGAGR
jgi:hypothetical protein